VGTADDIGVTWLVMFRGEGAKRTMVIRNFNIVACPPPLKKKFLGRKILDG
jgi:hypothetical protein